MRIIGIITTKDRSDLFSKAIETASSQSRKLDQIIVVSDSRDDNYEREELICKDHDAVLLKDSYAHNYAGSLNTAIHRIISDRLFEAHNFFDIYVAFLDDDDLWHKEYIEKCEKNIAHNEDFVISGINYCDGDKIDPLTIPQKIEIDDFLKSNPHIQGSNTFIKLATLLKAGIFDENMPSTTDRDLFVRVMLLKPSYVVINEHIVDINADNNRERITNGRENKADGLRKFYYKYGSLMSNEIKDSFFERAEHLFQVREEEIKTSVRTTIPPCKNPCNVEKYCGRLTVGFIATEYDLGLRLLKQLLALQRKKTKIIILINFKNTINEYESLLKQSEYSYKLIAHDLIVEDFKSHELAGLVTEKQIEDMPICDIAVSRSLLQHYLYCHTKDGDIVWVVDDDMELYDLRKGKNGLFKNTVDIDGTIEKYRKKYDAVIGNYALDAPLPTLSTLRTSLLDYAYFKINAPFNAAYERLNNDYYYDLTDESNIHLETPLRISNDITLDHIFSGKAASRPLYTNDDEVRDVKSRGGNTFIFNREILRIPNWSLQISGKVGRRSDYFWVQCAKKHEFNLANIPFAILHNRSKTVFDYRKEENKFLLDIIGASFTKAVGVVGLDGGRQEFFDAYRNIFMQRLTKYFSSYYRIIGLLQLIDDNNPYTKEFTIGRLNEFVKNTENYTNRESVINAFDILQKKLYIQEQVRSCNKIEEALKKLFNIKTLILLGFGSEGIVYSDNQFVYKWFFNKPDNWDFLKKIPFGECAQTDDIETFESDNQYIIRYLYSPSTEYNGGYAEQLADLIAFGVQNGFVLTNIKKRNFVIAKDKLKMIDYGHSIEVYTEEKFLRSIKRCYEMLRYSFLTDDEFSNLIKLHYDSKMAIAIDSGYENFKFIVFKRKKEHIHDEPVLNLFRSETKQKILDYGAGKCKIANSLADNNEVIVYDPDEDTVRKRAGSKVQILDKNSLISNSFDIILNNLVLCCTNNKENSDIIADIARLLKINGRAIISICCPFFNDIERSELRTTGNHGQYQNAEVFSKYIRYGNTKRDEYHRPIEYYENLLQRYGLEIKNVIECNGVDTEAILPIAEHIVFDCVLVNKNTIISDCSSLIKTNPIEHRTIYSSIKQKVSAAVVLYIYGFNSLNSKIKRLFDTLRRQTYQEFFIVYVDDASKNGSASYARFILENDSLFKNKSFVLLNDKKVGVLANFVMILKNVIVNSNAVVININNDDYLVADNAIENIVAEFNNGADITCGNCLRHDKPLKEYKIYSFDKLWERGGDNIWLHPKCFRRKLFDHIDIENDLKIEGKFVTVNTDFAFMLPMIEHSTKNVFIKDALYYFEPSMDNQNSDNKYEEKHKEKIHNELLEKARRRYEKNNSGNR
jgi:glycosyltransferase involved in cell wall biosynthesis/2-polyprenyl-3-methyl-5-hydroxy-6-metoxy-1,4-benzoquinol methylase